MQSIYKTFKEGNGREKLAIISDFLSILGISFAAILSPVFAGVSFSRFELYLEAGMLALVFLVLLTVVFLVVCWASLLARGMEDEPLMRNGYLVALWGFFAFVCLLALWLYSHSVRTMT